MLGTLADHPRLSPSSRGRGRRYSALRGLVESTLRLLYAGHTHGGHVALPGPRPVGVPSRAGKVWPFGLHDLGELSLFVSRGLGGVEVPFRTWAPPDVALSTLGGLAA